MINNKEDIVKHWLDNESYKSIGKGSTIMTKTIKLERLNVQYITKEDIKHSIEKKNTETPKEVIEDGTKYSFCGSVSYICPHCKQIMLRPVCVTKNKPKYCYKCGGRIKFRSDRC